MDVPKDVRDLAGTTSWQHSLCTTDPTLAAARRAMCAAQYKTEVLEFRRIKADQGTRLRPLWSQEHLRSWRAGPARWTIRSWRNSTGSPSLCAHLGVMKMRAPWKISTSVKPLQVLECGSGTDTGDR